MQVQPYLCFEGRCEEALEFYGRAVGAQVEMVMRFKDAPADAAQDSAEGCGAPNPANADKVMHSSMRIGDTQVMASDGYCTGKPNFAGISLALNPADGATAEKLFKGLADGGQVTMPLGPTFFASHFGMITDRFGVSWMVVVELPQASR